MKLTEVYREGTYLQHKYDRNFWQVTPKGAVWVEGSEPMPQTESGVYTDWSGATRFFELPSHGWKPTPKPKYKVGDLLMSRRCGSIWRVVVADKIVERVTPSFDNIGTIGFRDGIGNADMWATRVREVNKTVTEYVPA